MAHVVNGSFLDYCSLLMRHLKFHIGAILLALLFNFPRATAGVSASHDLCVLLFETESSPIAGHIGSLFKNYPNSVVVIGAKPLDFLDCIKKKYREIIFIAHGVLRDDIKSATPVYQLGYVVEMDVNGEKRAVPRVFFNEIFNQAYAELQRQRHEDGSTGLTTFRFAACAIDQLMLSHPTFYKLVQEFPQAYDVAPEAPWFFQSRAGSAAEVVKRSISYEWLAKSSRCEDATSWFTDRNRFCEKDYWPGCNRQSARYCFAMKFN